MGLFSFLYKTKDWFTPREQEEILAAVREAERQTSGEIRIFMESRCSYVNPLDRAAELFYGLKMDQTEQRNGVLLYLAMRDHQIAVYGDKGIHEKVGTTFWTEEVRKMIAEFNKDHINEGIIEMVRDIGIALTQHFPYHNGDKNELPDEIIFGK
ncbi:MAG TPA: TPM domain-containing protein [Lacibacter sp.]|nr:TPM domain-containing protein [Lacibacter sp.]